MKKTEYQPILVFLTKRNKRMSVMSWPVQHQAISRMDPCAIAMMVEKAEN